MNKLLLLFIVLVYNLDVFAQESYDKLTQQELMNFENTNIIRTNKKRDIQGSPYLNDNFMRGFIVMHGDRATQDIMIRFNIELNHLEVDYSNDNILQVPAEKIIGFGIYRPNNEVVWFTRGFQGSKYKLNTNDIVEIVYDGKTKIVKRNKVRFFSDPGHQYGSGKKIDRYIQTTEYYVQEPGKEEVSRFKPSKRELINLVKDKRKEIEAYVKANKLSYDEDLDIARILKHYETL